MSFRSSFSRLLVSLVLLSALCICQFSSPVLVSAQSCNWCRRVNLNYANPTSATSVCRSCSGYEFRCDPSFQLSTTCSGLVMAFPSNGTFQATCKDVDSQNTFLTSQIVLNDFIGNQNGQLAFGGSDFTLSCDAPLIFGNVMITACSNYRGSKVNTQFNLDSILANVKGQLMLAAPLPAQVSSSPPPYSSNLPICSSAKCSEGFLFNRSATFDSICIPCNGNDTTASPGSYCDGIHATVQSCPPGYFCTALDQPKQMCKAGCSCDLGSTSACPKQCSAGQICQPGQGSSACPQTNYCPAGATAPLPCDSGCICASGSSTPCPQPCPPGRLCSQGKIKDVCQLGHYCQYNVAIPCPAGTFGDSFGLGDDSCSGHCGVMWTSKEGSLVCNEYSAGGIVIIVVIVCFSIPFLLLGITYVISKLPAISQSTNADFAANARSSKQQEIRNGVAALASLVVKNSFPSIFAVSATLSQLKLDVSDAENRIATAKQELTDLVVAALLAHPRLHFDDETYPQNLPQWVTLDAKSIASESDLYATGNTIASHIRPAVEQDFLAWIQNRESGEQTTTAAPSKPVLDEESKIDVTPIINEHRFENASKWITVDKDLSIALRVIFPETSKWKSGREEYSSAPPSVLRATTARDILVLGLDVLVIVACGFCFAGKPLVSVNVNSSADLSVNTTLWYDYSHQPLKHTELQVTWNRVNQQSITLNDGNVLQYWWYGYYPSNPQMNLDFVQPAVGDCTGDYGNTYLALLVIACVCFIVVITPTISRLSTMVLPSSIQSKRIPANTDCHSKYLGIGSRILGLLALTVSVSTYATGCIARFSLNPPTAVMVFSTLQTSATDPSPPQTTLNFALQLKLLSAFVLTIAALAGSLLTTAIALKPYLFRQSTESGKSQELINSNQDSVNQVDGKADATVLPGTDSLSPLVIVHPAAVCESVAGDAADLSHDSPQEEEASQYAVAFHFEAEGSQNAATLRSDEEPFPPSSNSPDVLSPSDSDSVAVGIAHASSELELTAQPRYFESTE